MSLTGLEPPDWAAALRAQTPARVALGRVGQAPPLASVLDFQLAHSEARDAVWHAPDWAALEHRVLVLGQGALRVQSRAPDRAGYLRRPDLGRRLEPRSRSELEALPARGFDVALLLADGLSAAALERHALGLLTGLLPALERRGLQVAPPVLAAQARVALGDEVGEVLGAQTVIVLIGERPGLSAPDSMGLYLTHAPRVGRVDSERNCISNIHAQGLSYAAAQEALLDLLEGARALDRSGVELKPSGLGRGLEGGEGG